MRPSAEVRAAILAEGFDARTEHRPPFSDRAARALRGSKLAPAMLRAALANLAPDFMAPAALRGL